MIGGLEIRRRNCMSTPFPKTKVAAALLGAWSPATSGGWLDESPARGQCSVTALLLNESFGGDILKTPLPEGTHFYNRIGGERVDLTDKQFEAPITYLDLTSGRDEALAVGTGNGFNCQTARSPDGAQRLGKNSSITLRCIGARILAQFSSMRTPSRS